MKRVTEIIVRFYLNCFITSFSEISKEHKDMYAAS